MMSVGGGARRIELGGNPHTFQKATLDLLRRGVVCKIAGHERKKVAAARPSCEDTFTIGARILDLRHRRHQVRHNDTSRELCRGERKYGLQHFAVAQMNVRSEEHTSELQSLMRISYAVFCLHKQTQ